MVVLRRMLMLLGYAFVLCIPNWAGSDFNLGSTRETTVESPSPKLERLTGLVCMFSPVTPVLSGMMMGLVVLSPFALILAVV